MKESSTTDLTEDFYKMRPRFLHPSSQSNVSPLNVVNRQKKTPNMGEYVPFLAKYKVEILRSALKCSPKGYSSAEQ